MHVNKNRNVERSASTRAKLIKAARPLFAKRGFAGVGTEEIVRRAGVTRGALYHHFHDKRDLFLAVYEQVEQELAQGIGEAALTAGPSPVAALELGAAMFLDACTDPAIQQIVLLDAPSVLGWETWREVGERYGLGLIEGVVQAAIDAGELERQPVKPLAHLLLGAIDELALLVARAPDPAATRAEVGVTVARMLAALRVPVKPDRARR